MEKQGRNATTQGLIPATLESPHHWSSDRTGTSDFRDEYTLHVGGKAYKFPARPWVYRQWQVIFDHLNAGKPWHFNESLGTRHSANWPNRWTPQHWHTWDIQVPTWLPGVIERVHRLTARVALREKEGRMVRHYHHYRSLAGRLFPKFFNGENVRELVFAAAWYPQGWQGWYDGDAERVRRIVERANRFLSGKELIREDWLPSDRLGRRLKLI